jgi:hypothetical protein
VETACRRWLSSSVSSGRVSPRFSNSHKIFKAEKYLLNKYIKKRKICNNNLEKVEKKKN